MKRYIAVLTQTGQNAPLATVLENSLGAPLVWTRAQTGQYLGTLIGAFPPSKTTALCGDAQGGEAATLTSLELPANSSDYVLLKTYDVTAESGIVPADGLIFRTTVSIRVYE